MKMDKSRSREEASVDNHPKPQSMEFQTLGDVEADCDDEMENEEGKVELKDKLDMIIDLQGSSGMFKWGKVLETCLGGTEVEVAGKCESGLDQNLWLTALVIAYLEIQMMSKKDLWELVVQKARKYLKKSSGSNESKMEKLGQAAERYIKLL